MRIGGIQLARIEDQNSDDISPVDARALKWPIRVMHAIISKFLTVACPATTVPACSQADFTLAESKLRTAEAVQQKDRNRDPGMSTEQTRRLATSMETAASVANGVTQEVIADIDRFQDERGTMLVPQVSALVGCQVRRMWFTKRPSISIGIVGFV